MIQEWFEQYKYLRGNNIVHADCIDFMYNLMPNSIDGGVIDPPYGLAFMGKKWDGFRTPRQFQSFNRKWMRPLYLAFKPGAYGCVFGGTRTFHRTICALEDVGFKIRDVLMWLYVSGFPKGSNISEAIDNHLGYESKQGPMKQAPDGKPYSARQIEGHTMTRDEVYGKSVVNKKKWYEPIPVSDDAKLWKGFKIALKPAWEPIILIQKPREGTIVENILKYGTGALNIDGTRIPIDTAIESDNRTRNKETNFVRTTGVSDGGSTKFFEKAKKEGGYMQQMYDLKGRYPTNVIVDEMVYELMNMINKSKKGKLVKNKDINRRPDRTNGIWNDVRTGYSKTNALRGEAISNYGDGGGLGRFFYCPKAHVNERDIGLSGVVPEKRDTTRNKPIDNPFNRNKPVKNKHPTVKPIKLITYLVRLIKPPTKNPIIIDPFGGSGALIIACKIEKCRFLYIDREGNYVTIAKKRNALPLKSFKKYTDSVIPNEKVENQTTIRWL